MLKIFIGIFYDGCLNAFPPAGLALAFGRFNPQALALTAVPCVSHTPGSVAPVIAHGPACTGIRSRHPLAISGSSFS